MQIKSADVPRNGEDVVHYLKDGKTACPLSGEKGGASFNWPRGHVWSQLWNDVTCEECLRHKPADEGGDG